MIPWLSGIKIFAFGGPKKLLRNRKNRKSGKIQPCWRADTLKSNSEDPKTIEQVAVPHRNDRRAVQRRDRRWVQRGRRRKAAEAFVDPRVLGWNVIPEMHIKSCCRLFRARHALRNNAELTEQWNMTDIVPAYFVKIHQTSNSPEPECTRIRHFRTQQNA